MDESTEIHLCFWPDAEPQVRQRWWNFAWCSYGEIVCGEVPFDEELQARFVQALTYLFPDRPDKVAEIIESYRCIDTEGDFDDDDPFKD